MAVLKYRSRARQLVIVYGRLARTALVGASTRIQLKTPDQLTPGTVFAVKTNSGSYAKVKVLEYGYNLKLQWQTYPAAAAQVPLYRETTRALDDVIPLTFDKDLHRYIFADLPGMGGTAPNPGSNAGPSAGTIEIIATIRKSQGRRCSTICRTPSSWRAALSRLTFLCSPSNWKRRRLRVTHRAARLFGFQR